MSTEPGAVDAAPLIEQAPDAMIFAGLDGVILLWNPAAERIFGRRFDDLCRARLFGS